MEVDRKEVICAYEAARKSGETATVQILESLFGKETFEPEDVTERIKTFEDACRELGEEHPLVKEWRWVGNSFSPDLKAYLKLRIICAALNEGWKPQFTDGERRYFPWFFIHTKKELEEMDEVERNSVVGRAYYDANTNGGLVCAYSSNASSSSSTHSGSRLTFKSEELATYCGKQFLEIWADYLYHD